MLSTVFVSTLAFALTASASPLLPRSSCPSYIIINTRGTLEPQGQSLGFPTANSQIQSAVPGGSLYATVYPAGVDQQSDAGTTDIVNKITNELANNPNQCFVLEGYSQGAAATTNALPKLTGAAFNAVKAVVLYGNPFHKSGLDCNVDQNWGTSTKNVDGISEYQGKFIPDAWVSKTRDVCYGNDGICNSEGARTSSLGVNADHLQYPSSSTVQSQTANFIIQKLQA